MTPIDPRRPLPALQPPVSARTGLVATTLLAAAAALVLAGCASGPDTVAPMAVADAAVKRASSSATGELAPEQLRRATSKLAEAQAALAQGNAPQALRLAEQATLDAQVAELHAQAQRSKLAAQESEAAARALRDELNRKAVR
jgi:hypothetical protein